MTAWLIKSVLVTNRVGLHARPAVLWTKLAKNYSSAVQMAIDEGGPWIDAKSIVKVMALRARQNTLLYIRASGEDAAQAISGLKNLVESEFSESALDVQPS
jgi:phosphocarrier protein HPr